MTSEREAADEKPSRSALLALQRCAGNRAVAALLRQGASPTATPASGAPTASPASSSAQTIKDIVALVGADPEFVSRTKSALGWLPTKHAGVIRNLGLSLVDPIMSDAAAARLVCTGISERAEEVIADAMKNGTITGVKRLGTIERGQATFPHTAVLVELDDGSQHVIDWWKKLEPDDPVIGTPSDPQWGEDAGIRWRN